MRQRIEHHLPDRATVTRRQQSGTNELGEPLYDEVTVAADVPCAFDDASTSFVREESGERVQRPATIRFAANADVAVGDTVAVEGEPDAFEVRGIDTVRDHRRGHPALFAVEVERT